MVATSDEDGAGTALRDVDAVGGFFALATGPGAGADPSWEPFTAFLDGGAGGPLDRRIDEVAAGLGTSRRIGASLLQNSVAARFVSVLLAAAVEHRCLPALDHDALWWCPWAGGPMPLWAPAPRATALGAPTDPATADALTRALVEVHLGPLHDAVHEVASVPARTLWGNAASLLGGAVRVLGAARPAALAPAAALARAVVARGAFAGHGEFVPTAHPTGIAFARRSCCLFYRAPGGGLCEDCVLARR